MAESIDWNGLSDKDLPLLVKAFREAMARDHRGEVVVDRPPVVAIPETKLREIMREEIKRDSEQREDEFRKIVHEECDKLRSELFVIFDDLDMPLDEGEHRKGTRKKLGDLFEMHRKGQAFKAEFWSQLWKLLAAWILGIFTILGGYVGLKGGGSH